MNKSIQTIFNLFEYTDQIYEHCKTLKFYNKKEFENNFGKESHWPGLRSNSLFEVSPILYCHVLTLLKVKNIDLSQYKEINGYCHLRFDNEDDWAHVDSSDTIIIYLSPTNLNSGTKFYSDDGKFEIAKTNFIQNACVYFKGNIVHSSFGNHGESIENARMTLNFFMFK